MLSSVNRAILTESPVSLGRNWKFVDDGVPSGLMTKSGGACKTLLHKWSESLIDCCSTLIQSDESIFARHRRVPPCHLDLSTTYRLHHLYKRKFQQPFH